MSIRIEVIKSLEDEVNQYDFIPLMSGEREIASKEVESARKNYENARRKLLKQEFARFYRVVIFGSARVDEESEEYTFATDVSKALVEARGVDIVTGGGTGAMSAAHLGTKLVTIGHDTKPDLNGNNIKSKNHGVGIENINRNEAPNEFIDYAATHPEFSTRLQAFLDKSHATYVYIGGIGTLLELMMLTQTRQVGHLERSFPLLAHPFWEPLAAQWNWQMYYERKSLGKIPLIGPEDLSLITFTDKIPDIVDIISADYDKWKTNYKDRLQRIAQ